MGIFRFSLKKKYTLREASVEYHCIVVENEDPGVSPGALVLPYSQFDRTRVQYHNTHNMMNYTDSPFVCQSVSKLITRDKG